MAAAPTPSRQLIYVSYSRRDRKLVEQLLSVLRPLLPGVEIFYDVLIQAGEDFSDTLARRLDHASIVLFCLSPDSLASRYCQSEMETALHAKPKRIVPIVLKPCDWFSTPLASLRALPRDAKPVTTWKNRSEAFEDIARGLQSIVRPAGTTPSVPASSEAQAIGHTGRVRRVVVSSDGTRAVSASDDRTVIVWDLAVMQPVARLNQEAAVSDVAIDPASRMIATGAGASIVIWDPIEGRPVRSVSAGSRVIGIVWLTSGLVVLTESSLLFDDGGLQLRGFPVYHAESTYTTIASSWDRRSLVAGQQDGRCQWFQAEGKPQEKLVADHAPILEIHPLPDGVRYVSCSADAVQLFSFDGAVRSFSLGAALSSVAPMPDGKSAAVATADALKVIDLNTGSVVHDWPLVSDPPTAVAPTPDGTRIVWGTAGGAVSHRVVDMTRRQPLPVGEDRLRLAYLAVLELPELWPVLETLDESALAGLGAQLQLAPDQDVLQALQKRRPGVEPPPLWTSWITSLYPSKLGKPQAPR